MATVVCRRRRDNRPQISISTSRLAITTNAALIYLFILKNNNRQFKCISWRQLKQFNLFNTFNVSQRRWNQFITTTVDSVNYRYAAAFLSRDGDYRHFIYCPTSRRNFIKYKYPKIKIFSCKYIF